MIGMLGRMMPAFERAMAPALSETAQRFVATLTEQGETWPAFGDPFPVAITETSPLVQGVLDYDAGAGYGYDVWMAHDQELAAGDHLEIGTMTLKVQEVTIAASIAPLKRARCTRLTS